LRELKLEAQRSWNDKVTQLKYERKFPNQNGTLQALQAETAAERWQKLFQHTLLTHSVSELKRSKQVQPPQSLTNQVEGGIQNTRLMTSNILDSS